MTFEREDKWKILNKNAMQPIRSTPAAGTAGPVLLYAKIVGRPDTGSYPAPSPIPDLEILFEVKFPGPAHINAGLWYFSSISLNQVNYNIF